MVYLAKQIRYSEEFKKQAVSVYLQGDLSSNEISQIFHIHPNTLSTWVKIFKDCPALLASQPSKKMENEKKQANNLEIAEIFSALADIETQVKVLKKLIANYK